MTAHRRHKPHNHSGSGHARKAAEASSQTPVSPPPISEPRAQHERIGDILKRTRERRGDDLARIAEYLCIRRSYLEAIENSDYDKFPADAYVIGFLRSYAELLGLDGKETINYYRAEMAGRRKKPVLSMPTPMPESRSPSVFILIGAVITATLVYGLWYGLSSSDRATVTTPPSPPALSSVAPAPEATTPAAPAVPIVPVATPSAVPAAPVAPVPVSSAAPAVPVADAAPVKPAASETSVTAAAKSNHLAIRAQQSTWLLITDGKGDTIFDRVLKPGETYKVPDDAGLTLTTGNGNGMILTLDGVDLPKLSSMATPASSGIIRNIPLDGTRLRALAQGR